MSRVVLDFTEIELLWITSLLPLSLILFVKVIKPFGLYLLPNSLIKSRLLLPPSDGFNYLDKTTTITTTTTRTTNTTTSTTTLNNNLQEEEETRGKRLWSMFLLAELEAIVYSFSAIWNTIINGQGSWDQLFTKILISLIWTYTAISPIISRPKKAPFLLFFIYISFTLTACLNFISFGLHLPNSLDLPFEATFLSLNLLTCIILLTLVVSFPLALPSNESEQQVVETKQVGKSTITQPISPEGSVTLFAWISFSWVGPLIEQGSIAKLGYSDVWKLTSTMQSEGVRRSSLELTSTRMIPRIFFNNSLDLVLSLTLGLTSSTLAYAAPFFLKQILTSLEPPPEGMPADPTLRQSAFIYAALAFFAQLLRAEVDLQQLWHERRAIVRCRSQLMGEVYEKALKRRDLSGVIANKEENGLDKDGKPLDEKTKKKKEETASGGSTGKIVNLMSSDAQRVANQLMGLSSLVAAPFELVVAIIFLYQLLGWTCIAGLSVMAISLPLNHMLVTRRVKMHRAVLASRDKRMDVLNEFIQAIRFVKYSASEGQWLDRVFTARTYELSQLLRTRMNNLMIGVIWSFTPDVVILIAFTLFTKVIGKELTVPVAFTSLALFALVRAPMSMLPMSITSLLQTYVSIERLEAFLKEPEVESWVSALRPDDEPTCTSLEISITNATFKYQDITTKIPPTSGKTSSKKVVVEVIAPEVVAEEEPSFELRDISLNFPLGKLSLICGPTGSGKSSVFLALLGEMDRIEGSVNLPKGLITSVDATTGLYEGVAYTAQLPWLEHASIKNNILFGSPFEEDRYAAVLDACALRPDLSMFAAGDETEIGEKGISLSGGQKARVALARAVYSRAKTVLLDDPLSAIDMHTARHVFNQCLKGPLMAHRTIILITHHVALCLPGAEYIVRMSSGQVETQGLVSDYDRSEFASELLDDAEEEAEVEALLKPTEDPATTTEASIAADPAAIIVAAETKGDGKLVDEELRATGRVKWKVYKTYLSAAGWDAWAMIVILLLASRGFRVVDRYVLKIWGESYRHSILYTPMQLLSIMDPERLYGNFDLLAKVETLGLPTFPSASDNVNFYLYLYGAVCVVNLLLSVLVMLAGYRGSFAAARILFTQTLTRVAYAPFRYYDTTPTGRILNRFSTDFQTIDTSLTDQVRTSMGYAFSFIVNVFVIVAVSPSFIPPAILIVFAYVKLSLSYVRTSRDLRRLESSARSPVYSKFGETLSGIVTCRAFGAERRFLSELFESVDAFLSAHYASMMVNRYLLWRFDFLGALAVVITTFLSLAAGASPGLAALAITSAQTLVQSVYWLCRYISALEVDLNAVERVTELLETPQEPPMLSEKRPPANWPSDVGGIVIENLVIGYAPTLPPVIKDVSLEIKPRQKVGVVGRTGSGKSTFALSLLRFVDPTSGRILIDGIDITTIGLLDLRSRLTLIPQEAVLFTGTVRSNLDPFEQHTDSECMDALERVQMINHSSGNASHRGSNLPSRTGSPTPGSSSTHTGSRTDQLLAEASSTVGGSSGGSDSASETTRVDSGRLGVTLDSKVSQGGHNFSAGQRQLLAMARALLRNSNIIIMDESTASVDFATDAKIQHTIREEFADSLVITIAHRLRTVIDYDQILVLDNGKLAEFGTPKELLAKEGGSFRKMCEQASDWSELRATANASGGTKNL